MGGNHKVEARLNKRLRGCIEVRSRLRGWYEATGPRPLRSKAGGQCMTAEELWVVSKGGAEAPPFAVSRGSPEGGNSESPLWRLFWGVWGGYLFHVDKIVPQTAPPSEGGFLKTPSHT